MLSGGRRDHQHRGLRVLPVRDRADEHHDPDVDRQQLPPRPQQAVRYVAEDLDMLLNKRGFLARIFRPVFKLVDQELDDVPGGLPVRPWLRHGNGGCSVWRCPLPSSPRACRLVEIAVFPALFAAGMSLVDTTDGVLMLRAYDWAFVKPMRKLYYNITITSVSILVALLIGGIEAAGLISDQLGLMGGAWDFIGYLNDNFNSIGFAIIGIFIVAGVGSGPSSTGGCGWTTSRWQ